MSDEATKAELIAKLEEIFAPAIDPRAPYAKQMLAAAAKLLLAEATVGRRCDGCKFWQPDGPAGDCLRISVDENGYTLAGEARERQQGEDAIARVGGSELPAWLVTKAEFGCVLWAAPDVS